MKKKPAIKIDQYVVIKEGGSRVETCGHIHRTEKTAIACAKSGGAPIWERVKSRRVVIKYQGRYAEGFHFLGKMIAAFVAAEVDTYGGSGLRGKWIEDKGRLG